MMASITTFLKENYEMVSLFFGVLGVIIGIIGVIYEVKKKSKNKKKHH